MRLTFLIALDQIGIHFFHFLGDKAELGKTFGVNFRFVAKRSPGATQDRFTRLVKIGWISSLNRRSGRVGSKPFGVNINGQAPGRSHPNITAIKVAVCVPGLPMRMVLLSPATSVEINAGVDVADVDIVTAGGEVTASIKTNRGVVVAGGVAIERLQAVGRVIDAGGVVKERLKTVGRVAGAGGVAIERTPSPCGSVIVADVVL